MEENKLSFNELEDLIPKIEEAMNLSKEKQKNIDEKRKELREETRPIVVEEGKEEIAKLEEEKKEFDDMTKPSLNRVKISIDALKGEDNKDFNMKLLNIFEKRQEANRKFDKIKQRAETKEDLEKYRTAYENALSKIKEEEKDYIAYHEDMVNKLNKWDSYVVDTMLDLGMEIPTAQINSEQAQNDPKAKENVQETQMQNDSNMQQEENINEEKMDTEIEEKIAKDVQEILEEDKKEQNKADIVPIDKKPNLFVRMKNWIKDKISKVLPKKKDEKEEESKETSSQNTETAKKEFKDEIKFEVAKTDIIQEAEKTSENEQEQQPEKEGEEH